LIVSRWRRPKVWPPHFGFLLVSLREKLFALFGLAGAIVLVRSGLEPPPAPVPPVPAFHPSGGVHLPVTARSIGAMPAAFSAAVAKTPPGPSASGLLLETPLPKALRYADIVSVAEAFDDLATMAPSGERATRLATLFAFCCTRDPAEAAGLAQDFPDRGLRDEASTFVLRLWAESDPAAALAWANTHPRAEADRANYYAAFEGYAGTTPVAALRYLFLNAAHLDRDMERLTDIVVDSLAAHDKLAEAASWLEKSPAGQSPPL
jgi:hypothetical protein